MADLVVENLCKRYGDKQVLRGVNLCLPQGAVLCLTGSSGGGKTTLLKILCGLLLPDGGQVRYGEEVLSNQKTALAPWKRKMALSFQTPTLFPHMTVRQNLRYAAAAQDDTLIEELCEAFSIAELLDNLPQQLSGGQAKRVELARALAAKPQVLLLDEPTAHLEPQLQNRVVGAVLELASKWAASVLVVTHSREEEALLGAPTVQLREGAIVS